MELEKTSIGSAQEPLTPGEGSCPKRKKKHKNPATELDDVSMTALRTLLASAGAEGALAESEKKLVEYLGEFAAQRGWEPEVGITSEERKTAAMKNREARFRNVSSLLNRYRSMKRQFEMLKEELVRRTSYDSFALYSEAPVHNNGQFEELAERLEIMSSRDEKKFQRSYAPYIVAGQRLEMALESLEFAMSVLEVENKNWYNILKIVYMDGDSRPTVADVTSVLDIGSTKTYYKWLTAGTKKLTEYMFGCATNKQELASILVYFSQDVADDDFPEYA